MCNFLRAFIQQTQKNHPMLLKNFLCTCVLALILLGCGNETAGSEFVRDAAPSSASVSTYAPEMDLDGEIEMEPPRSAEPPAPPASPAGAEQTRPQRIIYTADARARVENLDTALARVTARVAAAGGFIASRHRTNSPYEKAAELTIRLPADQLDGTLAMLPRIAAEIDYQNLDSRDVTAQWLDLETRLQTKRDVRDRYVDILRNRAQKVEDILNAEDKIRVITEEIEAKEGQLRYLRDQVSLSTLTLTLYETVEYRETGAAYTRGFGSKFLASLAYGWELVQDLLLGLVAIWPLLLIGGLAVWLFRRWRRRA
jgi:hypothetical protein